MALAKYRKITKGGVSVKKNSTPVTYEEKKK